MQLKQTWQITRNNQEGTIDAISGAAVTFVANGASFTLADGDILQKTGNTYEENSSNPENLGKTDDDYYNILKTQRFPVAISWEAMRNPQLAGGDYLKRMMDNNLIHALRVIENGFIWGERPATTTTNTINLPTVGVDVSTMRGMYNYAQTTFDAGGVWTPSNFRKNLGTAIPDTVNPEKRLVMFCSKQTAAIMNEWPNDSGSIVRHNTNGGELSKFGIKSTTFSTAQNDIEVVAHSSFNDGGNVNKGLIFAPDDWQYVFMNGLDIRPNMDIQDPSTHGKQHEITGVNCLLPEDGGESTLKITNIF